MNARQGTIDPPSMDQATPQWSERVWMTLIGVLLLNSVLRGIRAPSTWAYTQLLLDYDFGFSKRALQGAILAAFDHPALYGYDFAFWYMTIVFTANTLLLWLIMRRLCATGDMSARSIALVFASSLAIVVLAHTMGYGDQPALLVTLLALATRNFYLRCLLVATLFTACLLIHETEFVIFFPVIVFSFLLDLGETEKLRRRKSLALCLVCGCVLATLLVVGNTHTSEATASAMFQAMQAKTQYPLREDLMVMLTTTFRDFIGEMLDFYASALWQRFALLSWLVTLPTTAYLVRETWLTMSRSGYSMILRSAAVGASLAPLAMHAIGFDSNRWTTLATITSFLVYALVRLTTHASNTMTSTSQNSLLPAALIAMNLGSSIPLFDGYAVRYFPFEELEHDLAEVIAGNQTFPPAPKRYFEQCAVCMTVAQPLTAPESGASKINTNPPLAPDQPISPE